MATKTYVVTEVTLKKKAGALTIVATLTPPPTLVAGLPMPSAFPSEPIDISTTEATMAADLAAWDEGVTVLGTFVPQPRAADDAKAPAKA